MSPKSRHRQPTTEELRLWREAMRDAVPLEAAAPPPPPEPVVPVPPPPPDPVPAPAPAPPPVPIVRAAPRRERMADLVPTDLPGFDRRTSDKFRKGRIGIRARIDLHGMTQAEAHGALASFVLRCWHEDRRSVLVITGKGSTGQGGVLKRAVPIWLNQPPLRERIIGIEEAGQRDGGAGALYVLLRRRRENGP